MNPNDRRYTLPPLLEWCKKFAGVESFDLDAAAERDRHVAPTYYDGDALGDGLADSWHGHTFVNPPWSDIEAWVARARKQMHEKEIKTITMVLPGNRQEQPWWQMLVEPFRDGFGFEACVTHKRIIRLKTGYPPGRQRYGNPDGTEPGSPNFNTVVLHWWWTP